MNWNAVPVTVMAGITAYAAILFYGVYIALARLTDERSRREYLTFALTCISVVMYDACSVGLYNASSIEQGYLWQRGQLATAALIGVVYLVFIWDFFRRPMPIVIRLGTYALGILGILVGFWESELTLTLNNPAIKEVKAFGTTVVYYESEAGIVASALLLAFFAAYATAITYMLGYFRGQTKNRRRGIVGFILAAAISGTTATNDVLIASNLHSFIYTFEYGITALLMSMGYILLMRFGQLQSEVNDLNRDLIKTNADLVVALEQAKESNRAKTEFLASISHELRTPLNAIINLPEAIHEEFRPKVVITCGTCGAEYEIEAGEQFGENIACGDCKDTQLKEQRRLRFVGDEERAQNWLKTVSRAGRHLLVLVNDILDASKLDLGRAVIVPSAFNPIDLINEVIDSIKTVAETKSVSVRFREESNNGFSRSTVADRGKLGQVLYNLLGNAIKFSPDKGIVEVSISKSRLGDMTICVRDYGIGIGKDHQQAIFEKFKQVDTGTTRSYEGSGLGLAISKGIVDLHGGRIWVESEEGQGASFYVQIPTLALPENTN